MPSIATFLKLSGILALGLLALVVSIVVFIFLLPFTLPLVVAGAFLVLLFLVVWLLVYLALVAGAVIVYFFRPMEVRREGSYRLGQVREAGVLPRTQRGPRKKRSG
ncbi:MAG: hypothetical protein HY520_00055 [Candidatus Aenigmarchaeota archaeon]|nr:hypothetical protein [Candidatus Aenigmarchaeota archaeon]